MCGTRKKMSVAEKWRDALVRVAVQKAPKVRKESSIKSRHKLFAKVLARESDPVTLTIVFLILLGKRDPLIELIIKHAHFNPNLILSRTVYNEHKEHFGSASEDRFFHENAFSAAVIAGNKSVMQLLLLLCRDDVDINAVPLSKQQFDYNHIGRTPLMHVIAWRGDIYNHGKREDVFDDLLALPGLDINVEALSPPEYCRPGVQKLHQYMITAFGYAIGHSRGNYLDRKTNSISAMAEKLLKREELVVNVMANARETALHFAVRYYGYFAYKIIEHPTFKPEQEVRALMRAIRKYTIGKMDKKFITQFLARCDLTTDTKWMTPLFYMDELNDSKNRDLALLLFQNVKIPLGEMRRFGRSLLYHHIYHDNAFLVELLLNRKDVNEKIVDSGGNNLVNHVTRCMKGETSIRILEQLLERGVSPCTKNQDRADALIIAARLKKWDVYELLQRYAPAARTAELDPILPPAIQSKKKQQAPTAAVVNGAMFFDRSGAEASRADKEEAAKDASDEFDRFLREAENSAQEDDSDIEEINMTRMSANG